MSLCGSLQLVLHILHLFGELLFGFLVELAGFEVFRQLFDFVERLLPIALFHGLCGLVGRAGAEVLHLLELFFQAFLAAELLAALFELLRQIIELHMHFGRIELLLLSELTRALFDLLEQVVGLLETFVFLELGLLLLHFLAERLEGCLGLLRVLRGGDGIDAAGSFAIVRQTSSAQTRSPPAQAATTRGGPAARGIDRRH